jgi:hypothetical protein
MAGVISISGADNGLLLSMVSKSLMLRQADTSRTNVSKRKRHIGATEMDREVAQVIATTASRVAAEIASLMPFLKEHGEGQKDDDVRHTIASAVYEVGLICDATFARYPDLKAEFEARVAKYGRPSY